MRRTTLTILSQAPTQQDGHLGRPAVFVWTDIRTAEHISSRDSKHVDLKVG